MLVCTTIVESGLDVSNANTMIIERADTLGLSQLHQLRGRVGRSRERAYAYFLYPAEKPLTETAHERLATLAQHSDLGGGMAIAMKDLEIRGAGNLLGGEQSGHIADVGFDLYVRLVGEAVHEFRGDAAPELNEVRIELPVDAHLPHDYIPSERLRLEMYKRLAEVRSDDDVDLLLEELKDRYGEPPVEVTSLLLVARFRARARQAGVGEVTIAGKNVRFAPVTLPESRVVRLQRLYPKSIVKAPVETILVPRPHVGGVMGKPLDGIALLQWAHGVIDAVIDPVGDPRRITAAQLPVAVMSPTIASFARQERPVRSLPSRPGAAAGVARHRRPLCCASKTGSTFAPRSDTIAVSSSAPHRRRAGPPLDGIALLQWAHGVIDAVVDPVGHRPRADRLPSSDRNGC